ncbi:peptidase inhibitor family I36 protein [Streptomyces cadmiisoli]|uniref:Peptidase inhibitor n=1 Tax=Streptomyces cadmiisoli TaxID=2184053 RepID=A0A2Z4JEX6_9ACTN|nr:peptidase inhibitor family I36 protein [Streptomyces cadmiisoli]AWW43551.1 hypothetical protein DN051_44360 [Streptomyces cadmiisoli]
MKIKAVTLASTVALAVGGALMSAGQASAAAENCRTGYFCIYLNGNWQGEMATYSSTCVSAIQGTLPGQYLNDHTSSVANKTTKNLKLYEHTNFGGRYINVPAQSIIDLTKNVTVYHNNGTWSHTGPFNDVLSSFC